MGTRAGRSRPLLRRVSGFHPGDTILRARGIDAVVQRGEEVLLVQVKMDAAIGARSPGISMVVGDYHRARQGFASDAELARVLGVHRSRVAGWKRGERPDPINARLLRYLATVVADLTRFMDPEVIPDWLTTGQLEAGGRTPMEVLRAGDLAGVLQLANATEYGAYV